MNQTQVNCTTCSHCDESFLSRGKYENHYKQKHQNQIQLDEGMTVLRSEDGKFICQCGKEFELGKSLKLTTMQVGFGRPNPKITGGDWSINCRSVG